MVRLPSGAIELDLTGRRAGRGAYVCPGEDCLRAAVKGKKLERALEAPVPDEVLESLARAVVQAGTTAGPKPGSTRPAGRPGEPGAPVLHGRDPMKG